MPERLIWQPQHIYQPQGLKVLLDREFARSMLAAEVPEENKRVLNRLAHNLVFESRGMLRDYYLFEGKSGLVTQVIKDGSRGAWLHTGRPGIDSLKTAEAKGPLEYTEHNVDDQEDVIDLLRLFDFWIQYAKILTEK